MKKLSFFSIAILCSFVFLTIVTSCSKNNSTTPNTTYKLSGTATGDQEVQPVTTTGTGTLSGTFNSATNALHYDVSWSNLSGPATIAHFHGPAAPGTNAGVVIPFKINNTGTSGTASGDTTVTDAQKTDLLAGKWYFNVHTAAHGGGEIRGQVILTQ